MRKMLNFPTLRQVYEYDCGASAMQSILEYYGIDVREGIIMRIAKTRKSGTNFKGIRRVMRYFTLTCHEGPMTIDDLKKWIDKKIPVLIALQAWTTKKNVDWKNNWSDGHYAIAIGYDKANIYFSDPSSERRTFLTYKQVEDRWHDKDAGRKKFYSWGFAISRPAHTKKIRKRFITDFWNNHFRPGFFYKRAIHMD